MREGEQQAAGVAAGKAEGPDKRTLAERFIAAFRLPYALGCVLIGFGLFGLFDTALTHLADSADLPVAIQLTLTGQNLAQSALIAYAFYAPRYMRRKLAETTSSLPSLMGDESRGFRNPFAGISSVRPQVIAWIAFLAALLFAVNVAAFVGGSAETSVSIGGAFSPLGFFASLFDVVSLAAATLALSSVVWTYYTITMGIHRFSQAPLELRPYYEDPFLGLKPIGSLALTLASVYFGFIALLLLSVLISPKTPQLGDILAVGGFLLGLIAFGVYLFFLPLTRLHRRMVAEKGKARRALLPQLQAVFEGASNPGSGDDLGRAFRVDMLDRKVANMAVWPYDIGILGRLSVIAASVTAILISRIVALVFHI
ncbi:MAG: hypothetical protein E6K19_04745 [Methanobacteriota archaeon]|nr:MAG: hypothetical protein E6K19_04745 [Euryarchaeota archaeon]